MLQRDRFQSAVKMIGPSVIAALEFVRRALVGGHNHRSAMRALIVQHLQRPVCVTHHDDRLAADLRAEIIADVFDLALVADENPGGSEDPFELEPKYRRVGVDTAVNARRLHKVRDRVDRVPPHDRDPRGDRPKA